MSGGRAATAVVKAAQEALFARRGALTAKFFFVHREEACMGRLLRGRDGPVSAAISHPWGISAATHGGMRQKAANFDVLFDLTEHVQDASTLDDPRGEASALSFTTRDSARVETRRQASVHSCGH